MLHLQKHCFNYALLGLALIHVLTTGGTTLLSAQLVCIAWNTAIPTPQIYLLAWLLLAATAVRWFVAVRSIFMHERKPIWEESEIIVQALVEIEKQTGQTIDVNIFIEELDSINASARGARTWTISTGALKKLTTLEMAAIFAHEQGHHRSKDTHMRATLSLCYLVNKCLMYPSRVLMQLCKRLTTLRWFLLVCLLCVLFLLNIHQPLFIIIAFLLPCLTWYVLYRLLRPVDLFITRRTEYRQDAYAFGLGFGEHLRSAFIKLTKEHASQKISWWRITFHHTHPIIHDRIRRLDKLSP
jgi:Zn-dependent protease with chaperone function